MKTLPTKKLPEGLSNQFIATINGLSHDGRGIAILPDGKTVFIHGALPGEKVLFALTKKHSRYGEGHAIEIIDASPIRTTPACEHFSVCGGCTMQHMTMPGQIELKQKVLLEQLKHFGQVTPETVLPPLSGNPWGYRRKARLGVRYVRKKEKLLVGFREKAGRYLADIKTCSILHPSVGEKLPEISRLIASLTQYEHIPQIEVAIGDNRTALIFRHLVPLPEADIAKLVEFAIDHQIHIYLQPNPPLSVHQLWPQDDINRLTYNLEEFQLNMHFHPLDFTQVNGEMNPVMIHQAIALLALESNDQVLDLFCGLGNFTLPIARHVKAVTGVEGSEEMVIRAEENARCNQIDNTEFYAANLAEIPAHQPVWMKKQYDKILLDPPRVGAKEIIAHFPQLSANRIVYVSCNPATLARDLGELVHNQGYQLKKVGIINMFPHTSHIEAVAQLEK